MIRKGRKRGKKRKRNGKYRVEGRIMRTENRWWKVEQQGRVGICTVDPADGQRLEDGEKQQTGSTAGEMVIDLEHIQTTLHHTEETKKPVQYKSLKTGYFSNTTHHPPVWLTGVTMTSPTRKQTMQTNSNSSSLRWPRLIRWGYRSVTDVIRASRLTNCTRHVCQRVSMTPNATPVPRNSKFVEGVSLHLPVCPIPAWWSWGKSRQPRVGVRASWLQLSGRRWRQARVLRRPWDQRYYKQLIQVSSDIK